MYGDERSRRIVPSVRRTLTMRRTLCSTADFDNAANLLQYCGGKSGAEMSNLPGRLRVADFTKKIRNYRLPRCKIDCSRCSDWFLRVSGRVFDDNFENTDVNPGRFSAESGQAEISNAISCGFFGKLP